jgi:hypothetical protein
MITLGDAIPVFRELRRRMGASEIHSEDVLVAYLCLLKGLPDEAAVASRVDQLAERNCVERRAL